MKNVKYVCKIKVDIKKKKLLMLSLQLFNIRNENVNIYNVLKCCLKYKKLITKKK